MKRLKKLKVESQHIGFKVMRDFDIWISKEGFVVTEAMDSHPKGYQHEVRVISSSPEGALQEYLQYCEKGDF